MPIIEHLVTRIDVEMSGGSRWYMATAMQGDRGTRYIAARLLNEGERYDVPTDTEVNVSITKADGKPVYNSAAVDSDGRVVFELTRQMLAKPGTIKGNIVISSADQMQVIRSATFEIEVEESTRNDDEIVSSTEFTALERKTREANELIDLLKVQIARVNSVIASGTASETTCAETVQIRTDIDGDTHVTAAERVDALQTELRAAKTQLDTVINDMKSKQATIDAAQDQEATRMKMLFQQMTADLQELSENIETNLLDLTREMSEKIEGSRITGVMYNPETYMLALTRDGEVIEDFDQTEIIAGSSSGGGGGGGTSGPVSVVTLRNLMGTTALSIPFGSSLVIRYSFNSVMDEIETGNGSAKLYVNSALKGTYTAVQGENTISIGSMLSEGSNSIRIMVTDEYGSFKSLNFTVTAVSLELRSTFNDGQFFVGDASIKFTPIGAIEKTTYVYINGEEFHRETTTASRVQSTLTIPFISHGAHPVEMWTEAELNGTKIESKHLHFNLIFVDAESTTPIVALRSESDTISEGNLLEMYWMIYDPQNAKAEAEQIIRKEDGTVYQTSNLTVDRTRQKWSTKRYPAGQTTFAIRYKDTEVSTVVNVTEADIKVNAVTNDLDAYLYAEGRDNSETNKAEWSDGDVGTVFNGMNWVTNGWMSDDAGDRRLKMIGGGRAEVQLYPFNDDLRRHGKTIEIEFMTHDVNSISAPVISCIEESTGIGFVITADSATLTSEMSTVQVNFSENKKVCIAFTVESTSEYRLMGVSVNGILTKAIQYPETDNFKQTQAMPITIGSAACGVSIYKIRQYSTALTDRELVNNYIADTADIGKKIELYEANDIYDEYNNIQYSKVVQKIPCLTIVGELPKFKGDKQANVFKFEDVDNPILDFVEDVSNNVQGTSSQWYVRKNFKAKFNKLMTIILGAIQTKTICLKADYAEGTSTHNTGTANYVETLYTNKTPAQENDSRCRRTVSGYPIVVFHQATESDTPSFVGKYNLNYDKGSDEVYGYGDFPAAERWEVLNNTHDLCNFKTTDMSGFDDAFEIQYPDEAPKTGMMELATWIASTYREKATGSPLAVRYTGADGTVYTNDTAEYRLAKFKKEFEDHLILESSLVYYVYTFFSLATDQRTKNMHLVTFDGHIYEPWFYDNDTIFMINNEGAKVFKYWHEDTDKLDGANVYNGQENVLWVNFKDAFPDEIKEKYQYLRSSGKLTKEKLVEYYITRQSKKWCANIYNDDSNYKYIEMLKTDNDATNLPQIKGSGEDEHEYFFDRRLMYCDSKWYAGDFVNDVISLRVYTPAEWQGVEPCADITLTSSYNMYQSVRYKANGELLTRRVQAGESVTHIAPDETFNDTETGIYGASGIASLGDLAPLYCGSINVSRAIHLTDLKVGDATEGYHNDNMVSLAVGANTMLQRLNIMNCRKLAQNIDLSGCTSIEEIYAKGSGITGVSLPEGGYLRVLQLPGSVANLTVKNQNYIEDFQIESYDKLTTLWVENSPGIPVLDIVKRSSRLARLRLTGIDWSFEDATQIMNLMEIGGIDENGYNTTVAVIEGRCHITTLKASEKNDLKRAFPNLEVTSDVFVNQHKVTFKNEDGTVLDVQYIDRGGAAVDPTTRPILPIAIPTKAPTIDKVFTFNTWDKLLSPILEDTEVFATYVERTRQYTVSFYSMSDKLYETTVDVYTAAEYQGATPKRAELEGSYMYYLFTGWDKEFTNITSDTRVNAVFAECAVPARKIELQTGQKLTDVYTVAEIYAICRSELAAQYFEEFDEVDIPLTGNTLTGDNNIVMQVFGFNHYKKKDSEEFAHVVFGMKGTLTSGRRMNPTNDNAGGWDACEMRTTFLPKFLKFMPQIWQSMIEEVQVRSSVGHMQAEITTSIDKLFLFSHAEVGFDTNAIPYRDEIDPRAERKTFAVFTDNNSRIKKTFNGEGSAVGWWLRSAAAESSANFRYVNSYGGAGSHYATGTGSVCFGFCVG